MFESFKLSNFFSSLSFGSNKEQNEVNNLIGNETNMVGHDIENFYDDFIVIQTLNLAQDYFMASSVSQSNVSTYSRASNSINQNLGYSEIMYVKYKKSVTKFIQVGKQTHDHIAIKLQLFNRTQKEKLKKKLSLQLAFKQKFSQHYLNESKQFFQKSNLVQLLANFYFQEINSICSSFSYIYLVFQKWQKGIFDALNWKIKNNIKEPFQYNQEQFVKKHGESKSSNASTFIIMKNGSLPLIEKKLSPINKIQSINQSKSLVYNQFGYQNDKRSEKMLAPDHKSNQKQQLQNFMQKQLLKMVKNVILGLKQQFSMNIIRSNLKINDLLFQQNYQLLNPIFPQDSLEQILKSYKDEKAYDEELNGSENIMSIMFYPSPEQLSQIIESSEEQFQIKTGKKDVNLSSLLFKLGMIVLELWCFYEWKLNKKEKLKSNYQDWKSIQEQIYVFDPSYQSQFEANQNKIDYRNSFKIDWVELSKIFINIEQSFHQSQNQLKIFVKVLRCLLNRSAVERNKALQLIEWCENNKSSKFLPNKFLIPSKEKIVSLDQCHTPQNNSNFANAIYVQQRLPHITTIHPKQIPYQISQQKINTKNIMYSNQTPFFQNNSGFQYLGNFNSEESLRLKRYFSKPEDSMVNTRSFLASGLQATRQSKNLNLKQQNQTVNSIEKNNFFQNQVSNIVHPTLDNKNPVHKVINYETKQTTNVVNDVTHLIQMSSNVADETNKLRQIVFSMQKNNQSIQKSMITPYFKDNEQKSQAFKFNSVGQDPKKKLFSSQNQPSQVQDQKIIDEHSQTQISNELNQQSLQEHSLSSLPQLQEQSPIFKKPSTLSKLSQVESEIPDHLPQSSKENLIIRNIDSQIQKDKILIQQRDDSGKTESDASQEPKIKIEFDIQIQPQQIEIKEPLRIETCHLHEFQSKQYIEVDNHEHDPQAEYVMESYKGGGSYEGYIKNKKRNRYGKLFYHDGSRYEGQWHQDQMNGYGKLFYNNGLLAYQGNWLKDEFHGTGKVYNDTPTMLDESFDYTNFNNLQQQWTYYEGQLQHDLKQGHGTIMLENGEYFEGDFHSDRINGQGKFINLEGEIIHGIWKDNVLIELIEI